MKTTSGIRIGFSSWLMLFAAILSSPAIAKDHDEQLVNSASPSASVVASLWSRATPPGGSSGAIYGAITNNGTSTLKLAAVVFKPSRHVMVHRTVLEDGMQKMKHASVSIEPSQTVTFKPGGLHIMLMGLAAPLKQGCRYAVVLRWRDGSQTESSFVTGSIGQSRLPEVKGQACH